MSRFFLAIRLLTAVIAPGPLAHAAESDLQLWYDKSASDWIEALTIGNGRFVVIILGQPENERFQLNEVTI